MNVGVFRVLRRLFDVRVGYRSSPLRACSSDARGGHFSTEVKKSAIPDLPTNCCMSGCANCVWIAYANQLGRALQDRPEAARRILNAIEDASLKTFLSIELKELLTDNRS